MSIWLSQRSRLPAPPHPLAEPTTYAAPAAISWTTCAAPTAISRTTCAAPTAISWTTCTAPTISWSYLRALHPTSIRPSQLPTALHRPYPARSPQDPGATDTPLHIRTTTIDTRLLTHLVPMFHARTWARTSFTPPLFTPYCRRQYAPNNVADTPRALLSQQNPGMTSQSRICRRQEHRA
jgi:hypothetical protein